MISAIFEVLFYALAAAASPLVLTATFIVVRGKRPRTNGIAFLSGFGFGTIIACGLGLVLGTAAVDQLDAHETFKALVALALGLALLWVAFTPGTGTAPRQPEAARSTRAAAILDGLSNVGPAASFSMAGLLGFGGPKRLVLTFLAMAAITNAELRDVLDLSLVAVYLVVSTAFVSVPVGIVLVAGERASELLARGQNWVSDHSAVLRKWLSSVIGLILVIDGLARLLT